MKVNIENLQDTFKIGFEQFESSRHEYSLIRDMYHNRMYTQSQLAILENRGQPAESYNVVKTYSRKFVGYFSSIFTSIKAVSVKADRSAQASLLTDAGESILTENQWLTKKDILALDMLHAGVSCIDLDAVPDIGTDEVGRPYNKIVLGRISPTELVFDPMCRQLDYSDARFVHRFKWVHEGEFVSMFGKRKLDSVQANYNPTESAGDLKVLYEQGFSGRYRIHDNYLVVHTMMLDDKLNWQSVYWHDTTILLKEKKEYNQYLITFMNESDEIEYYGVFREILESQKAINQALIQIQLMVATEKIFVEKDAVADVDEFTKSVNSVESVVETEDNEGIKVVDTSKDIAQYYTIIDRNLERIQDILAINDSFLGQAAASDSGRKVKLQQNASIVALRYLTNRMEAMYTQLGTRLFELIKLYYTANQIFSVSALGSDEDRKYFEVNVPFKMPVGVDNSTGEVVTEVPKIPNEELNDDGTRGYTIPNEPETDLGLAEVTVKVIMAQYNENDDIERVFLDSLIQGPAGQALMNTSVQDYFKLLALYTESAKTRHSYQISRIFSGMAEQMAAAPTVDPRGGEQASGANAQQQSTSKQPGSMMHAAGLTKMGEV